MKSIKDIIAQKDFSKARYNRHEFQAYGNMLAEELGDIKHRALYIKYAKTMDRNTLEKARVYVKDATIKTGSKARLFMWKLKDLANQNKTTSETTDSNKKP